MGLWSCDYYKDGGLFGTAICGLTNKAIPSAVKNNTCTTSSYRDCQTYKNHSSCFITSAVCRSTGKPDDCRELTVMRAFRDAWLAEQPGGAEAIEEYYACAPSIVAAIEARPDSAAILSGVYERFILPCVELFEQGKNEECNKLYQQMVGSLKTQYC